MTALVKLYLCLFLSNSVLTDLLISNEPSEYCNMCKSPLVHTLCKYPKNGSSDQCFGYDNNSILSMEDANEIIQRLNYRRNYIALGTANNTKLPSASNMRELKWSEELATFAQRWADQCARRGHPDLVDQCRDTANMSVNQNIATFIGYSPGLTVKGMVDTWFMESLDYKGDVSTYKQPTPTEKHTQHFTQVIWAETYLVGCGKSIFQEKGLSNINTVQRLVCNFGPGGNLAGTPVYSSGIPISKCPPGTGAGITFPGLCRDLNKYTAGAYDIRTNNTFTESKLNKTTHNTAKNSNSMMPVNKNEKKIRQINKETNSENVDFHRNYGDWHETADEDYLENSSFEDENPDHFHSDSRDKSYQITTDLPLEITIHRPTYQLESEDTPYKYTLLTSRIKNYPTESGRRMDFANTELKKCSRKVNQELNVEDTAEICSHGLDAKFHSSTIPYYFQHVINSTPKKKDACCPCINITKSIYDSVVTDNSWDCLHTSTDLPKYPENQGDTKTYTVFAQEEATAEYKRNSDHILKQRLRLSPYRQNRRDCTSLQRNSKVKESEKKPSLMQKKIIEHQFINPARKHEARLLQKSNPFFSLANHKTRHKETLRSQDKQNSRYSHRSKLQNRSYKTYNIPKCTKPSVRVRALKSATVPKRHKHKGYKLDEKITIPIIEDEMKEQPKNDNNRGKEKYLTFEELISLGKNQQIENAQYSNSNEDSTEIRGGRRNEAAKPAALMNSKKKTISETINSRKQAAVVSPEEKNIVAKSPKKCTRKHTCTWTATTQRGIVGAGGPGGNHVDGCSRTSTCTRENQLNANVSRKTTPFGGDLCERRFLEHGDDKELIRCNMRRLNANPSRNNRHLRNSTKSRALRRQTKKSRPTRSIKNSHFDIIYESSSFRPMISIADDFALPHQSKLLKFTRKGMKSRYPRSIKLFDLLPDKLIKTAMNSTNIKLSDVKIVKRNNIPKYIGEIPYNALLKLVTKKIHSILENGERFPCECFPKS